MSRFRPSRTGTGAAVIAVLALIVFGLLTVPRPGSCSFLYASDVVPSDYCNSINFTVSYSGAGTVTNSAVRATWDPGTLVTGQNMTGQSWDLLPFQSTLNNEVNIETQDLTSNSAGLWLQIPSISSGDTRTIQTLIGSPEQKRDQGILMTGGETIVTPDNDALDLTDMWTGSVKLIALDDTARDETVAAHHDGANGWRLDLVDNAGSLDVRCTVDATSVSIAFDAAWVDTERTFECELDSIGDGLTLTETVSGTTANTGSGPIGAAVAEDLAVGAQSLSDAIVLDFRFVDDRVRMSSLGVPTYIIDRFTLDAASASETLTVDTSNLPFTPRHLMLFCNVRSSRAVTLGSIDIHYNGDSTATNYHYQRLIGTGATASAARADDDQAFTIPGSSAAANLFSGNEMLIPDALSTRSQKAAIALSGVGEEGLSIFGRRWDSTAAITSVTVNESTGVDLVAGSTCGLAAVDERHAVDEQILAGAGTIDFGDVSITNGYNVVIGSLRGARAATSDTIEIELNSDTTGTNYQRQRLSGNNATVAANAASDNLIGIMPGDSATADQFGALLMTWQNGYIAQNDPHYTALSGFHESSGPTSEVDAYNGRRNNVERAQTMRLLGTNTANFVANSGAWYYFVASTTQSVVELDVATANITFAGIEPAPAMRLHVYAQTTVATDQGSLILLFNGDSTTTNYGQQTLAGINTTASASQFVNSTTAGNAPGASANANVFGGGAFFIPSYAAADRHKTRLAFGGWADQSTASNGVVSFISSRWRNAAPVTSATVNAGGANDFAAGTIVMLETVNGFDTIVRYGYDADQMSETSAVDPIYSGTMADYGPNALTANYTFNRPQSDFTVSVGPLTPTGILPGPSIDEESPDILGPGVNTDLGTNNPEVVTGVFYTLWSGSVDALEVTFGRDLAWTVTMVALAIACLVVVWQAFKYVPFALFGMGFPLVYGANNGYLSWWWLLLWVIVVVSSWFTVRHGERA